MRVLASLALALALVTSADASRARISREDAFIGYSERASPSRAAQTADALEGVALRLRTRAGAIDVTLREDWAPEMVRSIVDAVRVGGACASETASGCNFYRAEAVPARGDVDAYGGPGPPYALLQGTFEGLGHHEREKTPPVVRRGYACLIGKGPDFFIGTRDHDEWGTAHIVFGVVSDMRAVDEIADGYPRHPETWGMTNVTVLNEKVVFTAEIVRL